VYVAPSTGAYEYVPETKEIRGFTGFWAGGRVLPMDVALALNASFATLWAQAALPVEHDAIALL